MIERVVVDTAMDGPNPITVAWSIAGSLWKVSTPRPSGSTNVDHAALAPVLERIAERGTVGLASVGADLTDYLEGMSRVDPDSLSRDGAQAFWMNVYNAGALDLASRAAIGDVSSVLRMPGGFSGAFITVNGESLSLDAVEHAKVRRFGDPRIHGALVCGSVSCPTLRAKPYVAEGLSSQLDDQMRTFLAGGGAVRSADELHLSRVFRWYGGDFARPASMPTWLPARSGQLVSAIRQWLEPDLIRWFDDVSPPVRFQSYDWGLRCAVK